MTVPAEEAAANYVPAAAVIRRQRALFGVTGRKGCVGGLPSSVKPPGLTGRVRRILAGSSAGWESGIPGVAVKCVEIRRNTCGVDGSLDRH